MHVEILPAFKHESAGRTLVVHALVDGRMIECHLSPAAVRMILDLPPTDETGHGQFETDAQKKAIADAVKTVLESQHAEGFLGGRTYKAVLAPPATAPRPVASIRFPPVS